jgi:general secretion pathway protein A
MRENFSPPPWWLPLSEASHVKACDFWPDRRMRVQVMYTAHFGLTEPPFSLTPNPRYLYMSERHREGLAHLLYGIRQSGGFVQLTGEVGTGKTTLCRCLLEQLPPEVDVALVLNPRLTVVEFLATLCDELHVVYPAEPTSVKVLVDALHAYLLDVHARGRRTVLIIDEAQNLSAEVLEQIRLLTNLETVAEKLLQIILLGQPELARLLAGRQLRQLAQRVTARYHLLPFSAADTIAYIRHRLRVAGRGGELFTWAALRWVHRLSGGVPRLINVICDRALLGAYAHDLRRIDSAMVRQAGREVRGAGPLDGRRSRLAWIAGVTALGIAGVGLVVLGTSEWISSRQPNQAASGVSGDRRGSPAAPATGDKTQKRDVAPLSASKPEPTRPAVATTSPVPVPPRLADLLGDPSVREDDHAAFASLSSRWRLDYRIPKTGLGCDAIRSAGLQCLFRSGNWNRIRRLDLPVILELTGPTGARCRAALVSLEEERATLAVGGKEYTYPLDEIDQAWDGSFILVWQAPPIRSRLISRGMQGADVAWLRARLDALEGTTSKGPAPDVYDAALEQRVVAFQRSRALTPDGLVGDETLLQLTLATREPSVPSLASRVP